METLKIDILNPKAKNLLMDMVDSKLIRIEEKNLKSDFLELLTKLRVNQDSAPSLEEITKEVESVREARYEK